VPGYGPHAPPNVDHALTGRTRAGYLFAWNTDAAVGSPQPWPEFRYDNHNSGNYELPRSNGGGVTLPEPIDCPIPLPGVGGGGCSCRVARASSEAGALGFFFALALVALRRVWARRG
jgi:hypothetical protein